MEIFKSVENILTILGDFLKYQLFEINQTPVTVTSVLIFILFFVGFYILSRILNRVVLRNLLKRFDIEHSIRYNMVRIGHYVIMLIGTVFAFQFIGIDLSGLAVIAGFLSVGIGFGLQNITSNFVSGIILLFERPIKVGDRVTAGEVEGDVKAINMRSTTIQSLNNISIIVPNSEFIAQRVTNWSHGDPKVRVDLPVGVSYQSDLDNVIRTLREVAENHPAVLKSPQPEVLLLGFGDSSWDMELRVWVASPEGYYRFRSEINCDIVRRFRANGVEIPFPQRDLHVRSPLPVPFAPEKAG